MKKISSNRKIDAQTEDKVSHPIPSNNLEMVSKKNLDTNEKLNGFSDSEDTTPSFPSSTPIRNIKDKVSRHLRSSSDQVSKKLFGISNDSGNNNDLSISSVENDRTSNRNKKVGSSFISMHKKSSSQSDKPSKLNLSHAQDIDISFQTSESGSPDEKSMSSSLSSTNHSTYRDIQDRNNFERENVYTFVSTPKRKNQKRIKTQNAEGTIYPAATSPDNLNKLKSYIKTLRQQYSQLSKYYIQQQEDMTLMKKEMSFLEELLERRLNRIRELELEKRIEKNGQLLSNDSQMNENITDNATRMKLLDDILNSIYKNKMEKRISFIEEDEYLNREELIVQLKLENQKLLETNKKLENENVEWAKQIKIKQKEIDILKAQLDPTIIEKPQSFNLKWNEDARNIQTKNLQFEKSAIVGLSNQSQDIQFSESSESENKTISMSDDSEISEDDGQDEGTEEENSSL